MKLLLFSFVLSDFKKREIYSQYFDIYVALNLNDDAERRTSSNMLTFVFVEFIFSCFYDKFSIELYNFACDIHSYLTNY